MSGRRGLNEKSYQRTPFDFAVTRGQIPGYTAVHQFGRALDADDGVQTDVWDGADGTTSSDVWVPPTVARVHNIVSGDAADDIDSGTGMRSVRIFGLTDWDSEEVSEDVDLEGVTPVATTNSYVTINRMVGLTFGSGGTNAGIITATAVTDATITAVIQAGVGQTLMAIYGVPSTQVLHIVKLRASVLQASVLAGVLPDMFVDLLVKLDADQAASGFVVYDREGFTLSAPVLTHFEPPMSFAGPCIVKLQAISDTDNSQIAAGIDAYLVNNSAV